MQSSQQGREPGGRHGTGLHRTRLNRNNMLAVGTRLLAAIALLVTVFFVAPLAGRAAGWQPPLFEAPAPPAITAKAAYVYDSTTGTPLFSLNPDEPLPPGSLTKIVTALVVREHGNLDDQVTITPDDVVDDSQSRVGLVAGDQLTVQELLSGLLIPSGNDAALALARHIGATLPGGDADPVGAFVKEMNAYLVSQGMGDTHFENPAGLDGENHVATARDLALLTAKAMNDPVLAPILGTTKTTLPSIVKPEGYTIFTTNNLLVDGVVTAGKTGTTDNAGGCLITVSPMNGNQIVTVVLGSATTHDDQGYLTSPARYDDTRAMLAAIPDSWVWIDPVQTGTPPGLGNELAAWDVSIASQFQIPTPAHGSDSLTYRLELGPAADPGAAAGNVLFLENDQLLATAPVVNTGGTAVAPVGNEANGG